MFEKRVFENGKSKIEYVIDFPNNFDKSKKYPVIFYFHGMGMVQTSVDYVAESLPVRRERIPEDLPFIIVAPHCEKYTWIECFEQLTDFVDYIISLDFTDENKIYITGSSMGGYTCWALSVMYPEKFAAAAICCGAGMYFAAGRINFPVWAFHGKKDTTVLPRESEIMVERINACGGNAKLTLLDDCDHDAWIYAYTSEETYRWLISHGKN